MLKNCEKLFAGRSTRSYVESKRATRPQIRCGYPLSADNVTLFCIGVLLTSTLDESLLRKLRTPVIEIITTIVYIFFRSRTGIFRVLSPFLRTNPRMTDLQLKLSSVYDLIVRRKLLVVYGYLCCNATFFDDVAFIF